VHDFILFDAIDWDGGKQVKSCKRLSCKHSAAVALLSGLKASLSGQRVFWSSFLGFLASGIFSNASALDLSPTCEQAMTGHLHSPTACLWENGFPTLLGCMWYLALLKSAKAARILGVILRRLLTPPQIALHSRHKAWFAETFIPLVQLEDGHVLSVISATAMFIATGGPA